MAITFENTDISGIKLITPHIYRDERGVYKKCFEKNDFVRAGIECEFTETSDILSVKGALRGLHYQKNYSQAKLIHVLMGAVFDVALDLREDSSTFGKVYCELLKAEDNNRIIFIPEGFAHGFIALTDIAIFNYQCSGKYDPDSCGGIIWNDPDLKIEWPLKEYGIDKVICTEKDRSWPTFKEYCIKYI